MFSIGNKKIIKKLNSEALSFGRFVLFLARMAIFAVFVYVIFNVIANPKSISNFFALITGSGFAKIDNRTVEVVQKRARPGKVIRLNAEFAPSKESVALAEIFQKNSMILKVDEQCLSGCSEYVLAGAKSVIFKNSPLIGFDVSIEQKQQLVFESTSGIYKRRYQILVDKKQRIYRASELNVEFWKDVSARMNACPKRSTENLQDWFGGNNCDTLSFVVDFHEWFPTSQQLRDLLGLKFKGTVCADDVAKCILRLNKEYKAGYIFLVGDTKIVTTKDEALET